MTMQSCRKNIVISFLQVFIFIFCFIICLSVSPAGAQKTLESAGTQKSAAGSRTPDAAADKNLSKAVQDYFDNLFAKNYEEAVKLMPQSSRGDAAIAKIERWREKFMSPSDLKIINVRDNGDGTLNATTTFNYMNANGVKDIMREKVVLSLSGGKYSIKSHPSAEAASNMQVSNQQPGNASGASNPGAGFPVTMTPNSGAGMPDMAGLLSALSGGAGGAGATNIDPGELLGLMTELVNDPDVMALSSNPKIMELAKDPTIMSTLLSGNMTAIEANPKIKELLSDPAIRKIVEKVSSKRSNPSSGDDSGGQPAAPPSSVDGVDVDKIFD
ncbi:MAG: hypothetical protein A2008_06230 [Candidatus Wallbacteria bacterium GWC2_49_35]|uniref:STI1 domain-containing protein n=1 Tax=Candidatus Wallbacteria bacterium GWC2_49_35 TaxID=1817813 RepID=A0A1F7WL34_9BACT|nr:MAG: hypothetical protein A2008_06230 [Candidatus Wallbacteria bacterium GWC2_49_35]HBC73736.1 hypothetical protein [Candidatus Wallbacteria bacterium]